MASSDSTTRTAILEGNQVWTGDLAKKPYRQSGPRKRMFRQYLAGQPQLFPNPAHFVLKEVPQGFNQREGHLLRQPPDIVVRLDCRRRSLNRNRFNHIRVQRSLDQIADLALRFASLQLLRLLGEHRDELSSDNLALLFRVPDTFEFV